MRITKKLKVASVAVVAAAALLLTACSGGGGGGTTESGPKTLHLSVQAPPSNFSIGNWSGGDATLFLSIYDTIVHQGADGEIEPGIAESWEISDDKTQITFKIRSGQTFTNGEALDAKAVVDSLEAARVGASTSQNLASIASTEAVDDSTVLVTLAQPDASVLPTLAGTPGAVGAPEVLTAESSKLAPIGSGAYTLDQKETTPGSTYVLQKNDDYWNADAYGFATVEMQVIPDPTAIQNAIKAGQLDYAGVSPDLLPQFPESQFTTGDEKPSVVAGLWLVDQTGSIVPALADQRVRQAINMAFDRETIAEKLGMGSMTASEQIVSPLGGAWADDLNSTYGFDVDGAKELLADAGYADGFAVTMPSSALTTQFEPVITQSLADIGITVTWESVPFQDFYAKIFGGNYGMFFLYNGLTGTDAVDINSATSGVFNPTQYTTPEFEALKAEANVSDDADAFEPVNEYLVEQAWFAPLVDLAPKYVVPNDVTYTPPRQLGLSVLPWAPVD